jgi:hypothetical protein
MSFQPSARRASAITRPIPKAPPVTIATPRSVDDGLPQSLTRRSLLLCRLQASTGARSESAAKKAGCGRLGISVESRQ